MAQATPRRRPIPVDTATGTTMPRSISCRQAMTRVASAEMNTASSSGKPLHVSRQPEVLLADDHLGVGVEDVHADAHGEEGAAGCPRRTSSAAISRRPPPSVPGGPVGGGERQRQL